MFLIVVLFGAMVGSFLNVCIFRLPRKESIVVPPSSCPHCRTPIRFFDNIPVISFLILRGRCRACGAPISLRYPAVELLNALLYMAVVGRYGIHWHAAVYCAFVSVLLVIAMIDLEHMIIPHAITWPGILIGSTLGALILPDPFLRYERLGWINALIGAASGFLFYYLVARLSIIVLKKEGMGGGDIWMMTMIGGVLGWKAVILTTFLGSLGGSVVGLAGIALKRRGRDALMPFGPFLAFGAAVTLLFGQELLSLYLHGRP